MLSLGPPHRDALLSPLPRGLSPWGSLNSPTSLHSMTISHRLDHLNSASPVSSSRPETPTLIPRWRSGRHGSGAAGGTASTVIESWGSGGVMLENAAKIPPSTSPGISPRTRSGEGYSQSIFSGMDSRGGSRVGTPRSPRELNRKKGSMSLMRMQSMRSNEEEEAPMRIKSQRSLEKEDQRRESMYKSPAVENVEEDAFFTGACTPEPPPMAGNGGEIVNIRPKSLGKDGLLNLHGYMRGPPPITQEEKSRRPSTIMEDVPDCYTPSPETKGPKAKSILDPQDDELDGTTAATKSANGKESLESATAPSAPNPSTLLRLKYPSTHHATIEIQHKEGIRITTSGRGGSGNGGGSRISIQVDMDGSSSSSYTSTIRTGGKRGAMSLIVRPSTAAKAEAGLTTAAITPSSKHKDGNEIAAEDVGEEELIVATPPSAAKKSRPKSHQRHSRDGRNEKHSSVTPQRPPSLNLIDLSGGTREGVSPPTTPDGTSLEMWKTVRKVEKSDDLKRESASGSRIHSALMNEGHGQGWSILDRPISLQKRTSAPYNPMTPIPVPKQDKFERSEQGDEEQTIIYDEDQELAWPDSPTLRELPAGGKKPRPLSNSNVPVEVALTMGFRGVSGPGGAVSVLEQPPIPGMVPVLSPGSMGMEEMAGGWI